jgi:hypothetical protein
MATTIPSSSDATCSSRATMMGGLNLGDEVLLLVTTVIDEFPVTGWAAVPVRVSCVVFIAVDLTYLLCLGPLLAEK